MNNLLYFGLIAIQLTSTLATVPVPLQCFLRDNYVLAVFDQGNAYGSRNENFTTDPLLTDNLKVDYLNLNQDGFLLEAKDLELKGIDKAILDDIRIDLNSNISHVTVHTDMFVNFLYKADGSLFFLPINGEGRCQVSIKNLKMGFVIPFDIIDIDDKRYVDLKNYDYWFDVIDNSKFDCSNLYYGDKEKSDVMHFLMNQNWKFVSLQYGRKFTEEGTKYIFNVLKNYFLSMPLRDFTKC